MSFSRAESVEFLYGCQTQGKLEGAKPSEEERSLQDCRGVVHLQGTGKLHRPNPGRLSDYVRKLKTNNFDFLFKNPQQPSNKLLSDRVTKRCFTRRHPRWAHTHPAVPGPKSPPSLHLPLTPVSAGFVPRTCKRGWADQVQSNSGTPAVSRSGRVPGAILTFLILLLLLHSARLPRHTPLWWTSLRDTFRKRFSFTGEQWAARSREKILGLEETNFC